jgi:release factor glutamine methyltransferase
MMDGPSADTWRTDEALRWATAQLAGTDERELSARMLLAHVLGCSTTALFVHPERTLGAAERARYQQLIARRARHEPVAYLVGHRAFLDLDLLVDERVLIPRPETEHLVECALAAARRWPQPRIADIGTGSGAIAISLARHVPGAEVWAVDCSPDAIAVARQNARRHGVADGIIFLTGDLLAPLPGPVHVLVANLPYVSASEYASLPASIRCYEPRQALMAGPDGLDAIRALLRTAGPTLAEDGTILLEIGAAQGDAAVELACAAFRGAAVSLIPDVGGHDRVLRVERVLSKERAHQEKRAHPREPAPEPGCAQPARSR